MPTYRDKLNEIDNEQVRERIETLTMFNNPLSLWDIPANSYRIQWLICWIGIPDIQELAGYEGDRYWEKIIGLIYLFGNVGDGNVNISREPKIVEVEKNVITDECGSAICFLAQPFATSTTIISDGKKYSISKI